MNGIESQGADRNEATAGRVLIVDDDELSRDLAVEVVRELGYLADGVGTCAAFLHAVKQERYDAVLLDWQLPDLPGLEAARLYRDHERRQASARRMPVIAITGNTGLGDREQCLAAGMDDFLAKPFLIEEMQSVLARWIGPKGG